MNLETLDLTAASYLAILVGAVAYFALGALWYALLFSQQWVAATGRAVDDITPAGALMGITFVAGLVSAAVVAFVFEWSGGQNILDGIVIGALVGVGVAAMEGLKNVVYHFDDRSDPWRLYAINTSYTVLGFIIIGALYGLIA